MLNGSETWGPTKGTRAAAAPPQWPCRDPLDRWHRRQRWNTLKFTTTETWHRGRYNGPSLSATQTVWPCTTGHVLYQIYHKLLDFRHRKNERPRRTWSECMKTDVKECGLAGVDPLDQLTEMHGEPVFETEIQTVWYCVFKGVIQNFKSYQ